MTLVHARVLLSIEKISGLLEVVLVLEIESKSKVLRSSLPVLCM